MTYLIEKHAAAMADLEDLSGYIAEDNPTAAMRFLAAAENEFRKLAEHPHLGRRYDPVDSRYEGVRVWRISGFTRHLIFYRIIEERIRILRVLHGARDISAILSEDWMF